MKENLYNNLNYYKNEQNILAYFIAVIVARVPVIFPGLGIPVVRAVTVAVLFAKYYRLVLCIYSGSSSRRN